MKEVTRFDRLRNARAMTVIVGGYPVHIACSGDDLVSFRCPSGLRFPLFFVTPLVLMLARNRQSLFGSWSIATEGKEVTIAVHYTALADGLTDSLCHVICDSLAEEVKFVEQVMRGQ